MKHKKGSLGFASALTYFFQFYDINWKYIFYILSIFYLSLIFLFYTYHNRVNQYRVVKYKSPRAFPFADGEFLILPLRSLYSYTTVGETLNTVVYFSQGGLETHSYVKIMLNYSAHNWSDNTTLPDPVPSYSKI